MVLWTWHCSLLFWHVSMDSRFGTGDRAFFFCAAFKYFVIFSSITLFINWHWTWQHMTLFTHSSHISTNREIRHGAMRLTLFTHSSHVSTDSRFGTVPLFTHSSHVSTDRRFSTVILVTHYWHVSTEKSFGTVLLFTHSSNVVGSLLAGLVLVRPRYLRTYRWPGQSLLITVNHWRTSAQLPHYPPEHLVNITSS